MSKHATYPSSQWLICVRQSARAFPHNTKDSLQLTWGGSRAPLTNPEEFRLLGFMEDFHPPIAYMARFATPILEEAWDACRTRSYLLRGVTRAMVLHYSTKDDILLMIPVVPVLHHNFE